MPRSGLVITTFAPETAAPDGSFTVPVIEPVCAQAAAQNIRTNEIPDSRRKDFMVMAPHWRRHRPAWFSRLRRTNSNLFGSNRILDMDSRKSETRAGLLKRMNSAFIRQSLSSKNRYRGVRTRHFFNRNRLRRDDAARHDKFRVDSRTTSSGATFRCVAQKSLFSSTALIPSTTMPTAEAPISSIGWRTVVSDGV